MNHIYRVIFNRQTNTFQAVAETATATKKQGSGTRSEVTGSIAHPTLSTRLCALSFALLSSSAAFAAPTGGQVVAGQANIAQTGAVTNIHQSSQNAAINWQQFNIKPTETVNFHQPNAQAVTLNRVIGNEKSVIDGAMNANGRVFIQNPNGTLIGKNAQINVGGLVATTANISDDDFMNGRYQFNGGSQGAIENLGHISVPEGGVVALIAPIVKNGGTITAPKANVLLASAESFSITLPDNQNFAYTLDQGTLQGLVDNGGAILADGGHVVLTAKGIDTVKKSLIKHSGVIEANTVQNKNGVIELLGDLDNSRLEVSGTLKAEAKAQGDGGFIETSASQLDISEQANISTHAENGKTGTWLIDPKDFTVAPSGGDTTGAVVSKGLEQNNVILKSRDGAKEGKGDVVINDEISWNKNTLTLNAENDIHINKTLNGSGTAKLALEYGQSTTDGGENDYHLKNGAKVNLPVGKNFSTKKGSEGQTNEFTVIHSFPNIAQNYTFNTTRIALGKDIDLAYVKTLKDFGGWNTLPAFNTYVHGLGHYIDKFSINSKGAYAGLLSQIEGGEIRDLGLLNLNVSSTGYYTGGLVGISHGTTDINNITILGNVKGGRYTGGIIGQGLSTNLNNVKFVGNVNGDNYVGGLSGAINNITDSGFKGNVSGNNYIGGLSGHVGDTIENSSAQDININGKDYVGGLVGDTRNAVRKSYVYNGKVSGNNYVGGLIGTSEDAYMGYISESYFVGDVKGADYVGGLAGIDIDDIFNAYVSGTVTGKNQVGGLVGDGWGYMNVHNTYFNGVLNGSGENVSNLFGVETYNYTYDKNYFNVDKTRPLGKYGYGKTLEQMKKKETYEGWDFDTLWSIKPDGTDTPRLRNIINLEKIGISTPTNLPIPNKHSDINSSSDYSYTNNSNIDCINESCSQEYKVVPNRYEIFTDIFGIKFSEVHVKIDNEGNIILTNNYPFAVHANITMPNGVKKDFILAPEDKDILNVNIDGVMKGEFLSNFSDIKLHASGSIPTFGGSITNTKININDMVNEYGVSGVINFYENTPETREFSIRYVMYEVASSLSEFIFDNEIFKNISTQLGVDSKELLKDISSDKELYDALYNIVISNNMSNSEKISKSVEYFEKTIKKIITSHIAKASVREITGASINELFEEINIDNNISTGKNYTTLNQISLGAKLSAIAEKLLAVSTASARPENRPLASNTFKKIPK